MPVILNAILPIFFLICIGELLRFILNKKCTLFPVFAKKCRAHNDTWSIILNKYVIYIALPALLFYSLAHTTKEFLPPLNIVLINIAILIGIILITTLVTKILKLKKELALTYIFCTFFGNVAYIGFPFIFDLYPQTASELSILIAIHVGVAFTLGVFILEYYKSNTVNILHVIKKIITNPLLIAIALGSICFALGITLPHSIDRTIEMIAGSASPVVLIAIGLFMAKKIEFDSDFWHAVTISGIKLVIMPSVFILATLLTKTAGSMIPSIIEAAMPVALTNFALAEIYPMKKKIIADAIIISTWISIISLTVLSSFFI